LHRLGHMLMELFLLSIHTLHILLSLENLLPCFVYILVILRRVLLLLTCRMLLLLLAHVHVLRSGPKQRALHIQSMPHTRATVLY
jgi:hypothetical protein